MQQSHETILVTGGAGFIGSHVCEALLKRGDRVVAIDNLNRYYSPAMKRHNISSLRRYKRFSFYKVDIRNSLGLKRIFSRNVFSSVVHLAAMAGVRPSINNPKLYADVNVVGLMQLLEQVRASSTRRLILASSSSVYGDRNKGPFRESDRTDAQISPYGATKKAAEVICHSFAYLYDIQTTVLRFFSVYGPGNRPDMACYLFLDALMNGRPIMQFGDGTSGRDYTYIDDIVVGILGAIDNPFEYEIINLGNSTPIPLNTLISSLESVTGETAVINQLDTQPGDVAMTYADIDKAERLLGYRPSTDLVTGLQNLYEWYLSMRREGRIR